MNITYRPESVHPTAYIAPNATIVGEVHIAGGASVWLGIGAIVLNGAVVGQETIVGAGALVPEGMVIPSRHLALGVPARVVRELAPEEVERTHSFAAQYVEQGRAFRAMSSNRGLVVNKGG